MLEAKISCSKEATLFRPYNACALHDIFDRLACIVKWKSIYQNMYMRTTICRLETELFI